MRKLITPLLLLLLTSCIAQQAITDKVTFPMNSYLTTIANTPYPTVNYAAFAVDQSKLTNVMDFGAKGDGRTLDDAAIKKAFQAAKYGVLFPTGKTFVVSQVLNVYLTNNLFIYAYGATIKMNDFGGYGWLQLNDGKKTKQVIWVGGTIDGNQYNQIWFGNPHGGKYNAAMLSHNRLLGGIGLDLFLVKDVTLQNSVMDGFCGENTTLSVFFNCKASNGANFHYNTETGSNGKRELGAGDQGTYYKGRITGDNQHIYIINCTATGGSINVQMSFAQNGAVGETMPHNTLCYIGNCDFKNGAQDLIHFEDCYVNVIYNSKIGCDADGNFYQPRIWVSNRTGIFYAQNSNFYNATIHFGAKASMKLAMINGGNFTSSINYSSRMMDGADIVANAAFSGASIQAAYVKNSSFKNVGKAITNAKAVVGCTFDKSSAGSNTGNSSDIFNSAIAVADDKGKALGFLNAVLGNVAIDTTHNGGDTTHHDTTVTVKGDTIIKYVHDSIKLYIHDTVKQYLHDTVKIYSSVHDTTYITIPVHDTVKVYTHDTITYIQHDSVKINTSYYIHDTLIKHDTVYINNTVNNGGGNDGSGTTTTKTQVGLLPWQHALANGMELGRGRVVVSTGQGVYKANGILISPSLVWVKKTFPTDLAAYEQKLQIVANKMTKEQTPSVTIENEPNYNEENGDLSTYVQMVKIALKIFEPKGIEVYSGGLTYPALAAYCAQLYQKEGDSKSWQVFRDNHYTAANNESIAFIEQYIDKVATDGIHVNFNFHVNIDDQTIAVLPLVVAKLRQVVKGKIMVGECSFSKQNAAWVTQALNILKGVDSILLYSEENDGGGDGLAVKFNSDMDNAAKAFK